MIHVHSHFLQQLMESVMYLVYFVITVLILSIAHLIHRLYRTEKQLLLEILRAEAVISKDRVFTVFSQEQLLERSQGGLSQLNLSAQLSDLEEEGLVIRKPLGAWSRKAINTYRWRAKSEIELTRDLVL